MTEGRVGVEVGIGNGAAVVRMGWDGARMCCQGPLARRETGGRGEGVVFGRLSCDHADATEEGVEWEGTDGEWKWRGRRIDGMNERGETGRVGADMNDEGSVADSESGEKGENVVQ